MIVLSSTYAVWNSMSNSFGNMVKKDLIWKSFTCTKWVWSRARQKRFSKNYLYNLTLTYLFIALNCSIFNQTGKIRSGKSAKSLFFLLGLKYTLRTCFESKMFYVFVKFLSWAVSPTPPFQPAKFVTLFQKLTVTSIQIPDIWW